MTRLNPGDSAPDFTLVDHTGAPVASRDWRGRKTLLYFYPEDDTPGCTTEACGFNEELASLLSLGIHVVGVSPDSPDRHVSFRTKYGLDFTLLSDPDCSVMTAYGAYGEKMMYGKKVHGVIRSTFLIDEAGRVERAWYNVRATGHVARVMRELSA